MSDQFFRFRLDPGMRRLLDRLRDEKDINLSRWVQRQVRNALQREFPDREATEIPKKPPIATTETREPEPTQTPNTGNREVPEPNHADTETPKKPPIATTETREPEPTQTPTIGTREVPEPEQLPPLEPSEEPEPQNPPIGGWKPRKLPSGEWGATLEGEMVAALPGNDQLPGTPIVIEPNNREPWTTTIERVVDRTDSSIVVSRPQRDATRGRRSQSDA